MIFPPSQGENTILRPQRPLAHQVVRIWGALPGLIPQTDAVDGDAVTVGSGIITVTIGTVPAGASGEIRFLVTVP